MLKLRQERLTTSTGTDMCRWLLWVLLIVPSAGFAADFELTDTQGNLHRLSDYRGKWLLVNFWATWCSPCLSEIPELVSLHNAHKDKDLEVIGVAIDSTRTSVAALASKFGISYPLVIGNRKMVSQIGSVEGLPTSYLYAPNGELVSYQAGEVTRMSVETYIRNKKLN
ncbi:MAG: TlpA disulfide reductase family protein [Gallionella sp.]|nr:TlpA disulfide reductase family protein [Gallionella sp.]